MNQNLTHVTSQDSMNSSTSQEKTIGNVDNITESFVSNMNHAANIATVVVSTVDVFTPTMKPSQPDVFGSIQATAAPSNSVMGSAAVLTEKSTSIGLTNFNNLPNMFDTIADTSGSIPAVQQDTNPVFTDSQKETPSIIEDVSSFVNVSNQNNDMMMTMTSLETFMIQVTLVLLLTIISHQLHIPMVPWKVQT